MLHDKPPGEDDPQLAAWDMLAEMTREAEKNLDHSLAPELEGLAIRGMLVDGDPAQVILQTAQAEKADVIIKPSHDYTFDQLSYPAQPDILVE